MHRPTVRAIAAVGQRRPQGARRRDVAAAVWLRAGPVRCCTDGGRRTALRLPVLHVVMSVGPDSSRRGAGGLAMERLASWIIMAMVHRMVRSCVGPDWGHY